MPQNFKPENYNSLSPYFVVAGAQKLIDLLEKVFNATTLRRYDNPDGTIMHVELRIDDSVIMIGDSNEKYQPNQQMLHVYVPDVMDTFQKAVKYGCTAVETPAVRDNDPDKRGSFTDFAGNFWSISTQQ